MEYLIITAIAPNRPIIISELAMLAAKNECNIENNRITVLGSEIAIMMMVSGNWNTIAKLEANLTALEKEYGTPIAVKRTKLYIAAEDLLPYILEIVALDQPGIVYQITNFLVQQNIYIKDLLTETYSTHLSGAVMCSLNLRLGIPADLSIADFREQLALLCDDLNLDGILEPERD